MDYIKDNDRLDRKYAPASHGIILIIEEKRS